MSFPGVRCRAPPLQETLAAICTEGFDHRLSNLHGALGAGKPTATAVPPFSLSAEGAVRKASRPTSRQVALPRLPGPWPTPPHPLPSLSVFCCNPLPAAAGTYFAEQSSYSEGYSRMAKHSAAGLQAVAAQAALTAMATLGGIYSGAQLGVGSSRAGGRGAQAGGLPAAALPPAGSAGDAGRRSGDATPCFLSGCLAMLYCSVALGSQCPGYPNLRRPAPGTHSAAGGGIYAVFDNNQARMLPAATPPGMSPLHPGV